MFSVRQVSAFGLAGLVAAIAHYGCLIALVEAAGWPPVPATLCGYLVGGAVSYSVNRRLTFPTERSHRDALWRFAVVAGVGFGLTWLLMSGLTGWFSVPYLVAQLITTGGVMLWSFVAHKIWTFADFAPP